MYLFRLKFYLNGDTFDSEEAILELFSSNKDILYTLESDKTDLPLKESRDFIIKGVGFSTEEAALEAGEDAETALLIYGLKNKLGVSQINIEILEQRENIRVVASGVGRASATTNVSRQVNPFIESFQQCIALEFGYRLKSGIDLYNTSHLQSSILGSSIYAKFLTLLIVIETQIEEMEVQKDNNDNEKALEHVKSLIKQTNKSDLNSYWKGNFTSKLGELKRESITSAGKRLMEEHLEHRQYNGKPAKDFFNECYGIRSDIVHGREQPAIEDLAKIIKELDKMVSDFLTSCIEKEKHSSIQ